MKASNMKKPNAHNTLIIRERKYVQTFTYKYEAERHFTGEERDFERYFGRNSHTQKQCHAYRFRHTWIDLEGRDRVRGSDTN